MTVSPGSGGGAVNTPFDYHGFREGVDWLECGVRHAVLPSGMVSQAGGHLRSP